MTARERARQYLEDYAAGQIYRSARMTIDKDQIIVFAGQFDPQPYHPDEEAAHKSVFGGLGASGWHTAALTMRLLVASEFRPAHGILGVGVDELRWPRPARPRRQSICRKRSAGSAVDPCARRRSIKAASRCKCMSATFSFRAGQPPAKCTAHVRAPRFSARKSDT